MSFWASVSTLVKVMLPGLLNWLARASKAGAMILHGPHHVAQKSVTTTRDDERTDEKCCGEEMSTIIVSVIVF